MDASLDNLVKNLRNDNEFDSKYFLNLQNHFLNQDIKLLLRKGVYPYEYMNSVNKFEEICLPFQEQFYSTLTQKHISKEDYKHAIQVWKKFQVKNLGEYHDLYLTCDVLQLADVFEHFHSSILILIPHITFQLHNWRGMLC